jgi:hypothetical protein
MNEKPSSAETSQPHAQSPRIPFLIAFLGRHLALGLAFGLVFAASLVLFDVAGLKSLIETTSEPYVAIALLYAFNALTFGSLAMGIAVMTLPMDDVCDMRDPERRREDDDD